MVNSSKIPEQTPVKFLKLNIPCLACLQAYYKHIRKGVVTVQNILAIYLRVTEFIKSFSVDIDKERDREREEEARAPKGKIQNPKHDEKCKNQRRAWNSTSEMPLLLSHKA